MLIIDLVNNMMLNTYGQITLWLTFIIIVMFVDVITGFIQGVINKNLESGKISSGILKKTSILLVLIIVVPFTVLLPDVVSESVIIGVYTLETINEFVSILENLRKMGINIKVFEPITKLLKGESSEPETSETEINEKLEEKKEGYK